MYKTLIAIILLASLNTANATIYKIQIVNDPSVSDVSKSSTESDSKTGYYSIFWKGVCEGVLKNELNSKSKKMATKHLEHPNHLNVAVLNDAQTVPGLRHSKMDLFTSETRQVFSISDLILKYEQLILTQKDIKAAIIGKEATDLVYKLTKTENSYTIEIFTAEDAKKMMSNLSID